MQYRRYPYNSRRTPYWNTSLPPKEGNTAKADGFSETVSIPLPNVSEDETKPSDAQVQVRGENRPWSFFDFFKGRIQTEDIILIILFILLLSEGIQDELLLILLVYILL